MTDNQSMAKILNEYLSSAANTTSVSDRINTNDINSNDATSSALIVGKPDAMNEPGDNNNFSVSNITKIIICLTKQS